MKSDDPKTYSPPLPLIEFNIVDKCEQCGPHNIVHPVKQQARNFFACKNSTLLWSVVDTMSPQYVSYWIAVGNKKLAIQKVVCTQKLNGKSCIQNTKLCV